MLNLMTAVHLRAAGAWASLFWGEFMQHESVACGVQVMMYFQ